MCNHLYQKSCLPVDVGLLRDACLTLLDDFKVFFFLERGKETLCAAEAASFVDFARAVLLKRSTVVLINMN